MKTWEYYTSIVLAVLCLIITGVWMTLAYSNQNSLAAIQNQQMELRQTQVFQQVTTSIIRQMAPMALKNDNVKNLLARHGVTVSVNQEEPGARR